jgi:hypothetical protein
MGDPENPVFNETFNPLVDNPFDPANLDQLQDPMTVELQSETLATDAGHVDGYLGGDYNPVPGYEQEYAPEYVEGNVTGWIDGFMNPGSEEPPADSPSGPGTPAPDPGFGDDGRSIPG